MKKNLGVKPYLMPMPVLIIGTYNENGTANAMNAAWGTLSDANVVALYLDKTHKTVENIFNKKGFTVGIANEKSLVSSDYVGIVSGNKEPNKIEKSGFTPIISRNVDAPYFEELPLTLECKFMSMDEESGCVLGEIVNTIADETVLDEKGNVDILKVNPLCFDQAGYGYYTLNKKVGQAFHDGLKSK